MLAAEDLLKALSEKESEDNYKNYNNDHNFGDVLELYRDDTVHNLEVICSDGQKRDLLLKN